MTERPVVVVGGGIVGSAIAVRLLDLGMETVLVDRDAVPQGASALSFASISAFDEPVRELYLLKSLGMIAWHEWGDRLGEDVGLRWTGEVRYAIGDEATSYVRARFDRAVARGYPTRRLSSTELAFALGGDVGGIDFGCVNVADGQVDASHAVAAARRLFERRGGRMLVGRAAVAFEDDGPAVRVVDDRIPATTVVLATGAETMALADRLGWEIPMESSPGLLVFTTPVAPFLDPVAYVYDSDRPWIHLRQLDDGRVVIGERSQSHVAHDPSERHAHDLLREAARRFPQLAQADLDRYTVEWRPMPRDSMPVVGPVPGLESLYVATSHSGVTLAPVLGALVAREIHEGAPQERLERFRPGRFASENAEAAARIEEVFRGGMPELFLG